MAALEQPGRLAPRAAPQARSARDLVAVLYRQASLIVVCALAGSAASLVLDMRQPGVDASSAKVRVQTDPLGAPSLPSGAAASRDKPYPDAYALIEGGLKLDLSLDAAVTGVTSSPMMTALTAHAPEPPRRPDEARQSDTDVAAHPVAGQNQKTVALRGPFAGLLLGLLLAVLRELGGDRLRSSRDVERALGASVLGAIPTLSAKARSAYLGSPAPARAATQLA